MTATGWPAAQADEFAPGIICRVIDRKQEDLYGKKVEILEMCSYNLAVFKVNGEKISLRIEQLKPLQRSPNYFINLITAGIGLPHNLAIAILREIADQVKLPRDLLDEISKFG